MLVVVVMLAVVEGGGSGLFTPAFEGCLRNSYMAVGSAIAMLCVSESEQCEQRME